MPPLTYGRAAATSEGRARLEAPEQPLVDERDAPGEDRQVPVVHADAHLGAGGVAGEPLSVADRDEAVVAPVEDERGHGDRVDREAERAQEGEVVVHPAVDAGAEHRGHARQPELAEALPERLDVGAAEQRPELLRLLGTRAAEHRLRLL